MLRKWGLPRWEQVVFQAVNTPFSILNMVLGFLLWIPFQIMIFLTIPFLVLVLMGSAIWLVCLGVLLALSFLTEKISALRPVTFILALPVLIIAHNVNGLIPAPTSGDIEAKVEKWDLIEAFPLTWSLLRFSFTTPTQNAETDEQPS